MLGPAAARGPISGHSVIEVAVESGEANKPSVIFLQSVLTCAEEEEEEEEEPLLTASWEVVGRVSLPLSCPKRPDLCILL